MKEALVFKDPTAKIIDFSTPKPELGEVVTKVVVGGCNQNDW
jgi:hypothetical protein